MKCPKCEYPLECHTCITEAEAKPEPGDATVCAGCASVLEFTDDGLCVMSDEEFDKLPNLIQKDLRFAQQIAVEHRRRFN